MKLICTVISMAVAVTAHGHVTNIVVNGVYYRNFLPNIDPYDQNPPKVMGWTAGNTDNGYVAPNAFQSPDIICHRSATPGQAHVAVRAGDSISIQWNTWPESHHGPVITYLANCNGTCETVDKTALKFFKINGAGLVSGYNPGYWADDVLISNGASWLVNIPKDIAPGNYVLRHEIIALHGAHEDNAAQAYPQCFNLEISGTGTSQPSGVNGTELYRATDPGILFNLYTKFTTYPVPGPTLIPGAVSSVPQFKSSVTVTSTATTPGQTSVVPTAPTTSTLLPTTNLSSTSAGNTSPSSTSFTGPVGQCGGFDYQGPTSCYGANSCSTLNPYYAQCVPRPFIQAGEIWSFPT
ncbi:glycoside hydrolase family 61 protein [Diaporthe sp. PMI_573]|nr:glycoside hydrolase family 61 protein [Diaporthaceae sp. PMI_573]